MENKDSGFIIVLVSILLIVISLFFSDQEKVEKYHAIETQIINNEKTIIYNTEECSGNETDMLNKARKTGYKVSKLSEKDKEDPGTPIFTGSGGFIIIPGNNEHVTTYSFNK